MGKVDISPLKNYIKVCNELLTELLQKYKCDWDDPVHESFDVYNMQVRKQSEAFSSEFEKISRINEMALGNEQYLSRADHLIEEVNSL